MPQRVTQFLPGSFYHLYNRALSGVLLFSSPDDYKRLLRMLKAHLECYQAAIIAYCLLPTHYHFVLRQNGEVPLSRLVQTLFNGYVQATNKARQCRGPRCEGRFHAKLIGTDDHLLQVCRYVHPNPVEAGLVTRPEEWPWSNYREWMGLRHSNLVCREVVEALVAVYGDYRL
jgi:putative transposase